MELKLLGAIDKNLQVSDVVFGCDFNEPLIHQIVTSYQAAARAGTQAQKTRAEVSGGGIKPWRQKGTGRARAGTIRSPLWRKGGVVFAAKPRSYQQKVNKKMYRGAMRSIFSELVRSGRLHVIESIELKSHKTKEFIQFLNDLNLQGPALIVTQQVNRNLYLAARNLPTVQLADIVSINPVSLIKHKAILMTVDAVKQLEELLI